MDVAVGVGWGLGILLVAATIGMARRIRAGGAGPGAWVLLAAAAGTVPLVPSPGLPVRVEGVRYAGPDLLADAAVRTVLVADSACVLGLSRVRRSREVQGDTLLREVREVRVPVPWLWVLVVAGLAGWGRRRRGRAAVLLLAALGACTGEEAPGRAELRLEEVLEMHRTGSVDDVSSVFLPEAVYEDVAGGVEYRGIPEIADRLGWVHGWASGVFLDVIRVHGGDRVASAEWVLDGTQTAPIPGLVDAVTGRRFQLRGITVVEVERGAVIRAVDYTDLVSLLLDLGGEIHTPDGGVLRREPPDTSDATPGGDPGP